MYGKCKDCKKMMSCWLPFGVKFGFCETSFEPKEQPASQNNLQSNAIGMRWRKLSSTEWEASGKDGKFRIEFRRGKFWAQYGSAIYASFNMRPKSTLSDAKKMCEDNEYWEYARQ